MSVVKLKNMDETLRYLDGLGARGDLLTRSASTGAAHELRNTWLVQTLGGHTGIKRSEVLSQMVVKPATNKYPEARINFSGSGILAKEYSHYHRVVDARHNRAQIIVDWIGGTKIASGFVNPHGVKKAPLSTRNQKVSKKGKVYTYYEGRLMDAMGPSLATAYLALPENQVQEQAAARLAGRVSALLGDLL